MTTTTTSICLTLLVLILSIFYLDAFIPEAQRFPCQRSSRSQSIAIQTQAAQRQRISMLWGSNSNNKDSSSSLLNSTQPLTHADIVWKLRPPQETSRWKKLWLRFAANLIRLDCKLFRKDPPVALCPKGGQAVLEAYVDGSKVGRFGLTTERGPPAPPIQETVQDLYGIGQMMVGCGAIIYMFVEPPHRGRHIGALALEVLALIHAIQGMDFTVLVVDDNGSGKLIEWYLEHGYQKAPKLQDMLGSPNAKHGITMIAPTNNVLPMDCRIQWW